jgi:hypothetical protein
MAVKRIALKKGDVRHEAHFAPHTSRTRSPEPPAQPRESPRLEGRKALLLLSAWMMTGAVKP